MDPAGLSNHTCSGEKRISTGVCLEKDDAVTHSLRRTTAVRGGFSRFGVKACVYPEMPASVAEQTNLMIKAHSSTGSPWAWQEPFDADTCLPVSLVELEGSCPYPAPTGSCLPSSLLADGTTGATDTTS